MPGAMHAAMPLPPASAQRQLKHRRSITLEVYERADGCWEVDARLLDVKTHDWGMATGVRPAGSPVHDLHLRLVVDEKFNVVDAGSHSEWMPYPDHCGRHGAEAEAGDAYSRLIGLNLRLGFRQGVKERLAGVLGCTHLTDLSQAIPTAVIQAFAGRKNHTPEGTRAITGQRPFQIDRCHALASDGGAVMQFYPHWYRPPGTAGAAAAPTLATPTLSSPRPAEDPHVAADR